MITFGKNRLRIEDVVAIANQQVKVTLSDDPVFVKKIQTGADFIDKLLREDGVIYGVTTGYGDSCTVAIPPALVNELPHHLYTFHGCGMGDTLPPALARAVLVARLVSLSYGYSGVSLALLQQLLTLIDKDIVPVIPAEGSVGASGDLTPLSYVAAVLCGEREVFYQGEIKATADVFAALNIQPIKLRPKEGLAIMNGTAVMTSLACVAFQRAEYVMKLATRITAMATIATNGNPSHFNETLFSVKPHAGQQAIAQWLRDDLQSNETPRNSERLQDRYSLRCAPHVIGVVADTLPWLRQIIENELNSANDNPIIDGDNEHVLHGGHFYGGHIATAMDTLKTVVANIADLLDRQMALMMDTKFNHGLPANLSGASGERAAINHGFKAVQIGTSAWAAEALKHTMPASVFSRSTECHNQDKVSMGTIAARDCLRVLQLTEQVAAAVMLAACQGVELRREQSGFDKAIVSETIKQHIDGVREISPFIHEDRALDRELNAMVDNIQQRRWALYE